MTSTNTTDVVVVGAGVSGLHAATVLERNNIDFVVLEARDRVGGRLLSPAVGDGRVDLGATWFWANEPRIVTLIRDGVLPVFEQHIDGDMVYQPQVGGEQRLSGNQLGTPSGRLASGMQSVPELLADQLPNGSIHLGTEVTSITLADGRVRVEADGLSWTAQQVIIAIPPALAMASIDFGDGISDLVAGVARATPVWMGSTVKVVAVYERAFWRDQGLAGSAFSHSGPMREIHDMSGPDGAPAALFGFCALEPGAAAPTEAEAIAQLSALFGDEAGEPTDVFIMDWRTEAFTSPPNVERLTNYQTYGHPRFQEPALDGRLHWASTETSPVAPGHIEGALTAAERAAGAIVNSLNRANGETP